MSRPRPARTKGEPLASAFARVLLQALIQTIRTLEENAGEGVRRRDAIHHLRALRPPLPGAASCPAYGILWGMRGRWVEAFIDEALEAGFLESADGDRILLAAGATRRAASGDLPLPPPPPFGRDPDLEEALRALRRRLAREAGRPAFSIFPNEALAHLAATPPESLAELSAVPGFGAARISRYGKRIVALVRKHKLKR